MDLGVQMTPSWLRLLRYVFAVYCTASLPSILFIYLIIYRPIKIILDNRSLLLSHAKEERIFIVDAKF